MKTAQLQVSRASSLKDQIFETLRHTKLQSVTNLLKQTRSRGKSDQPYSSQHSYLKPSTDSLNIHTELSPHRQSFSPPSSQPHLHKQHRSTDNLHSGAQRELLKRHLRSPHISKHLDRGVKNESNEQKQRSRKHKKKSADAKGERYGLEKIYYSKSRSKQSKSKDRQSKLNLSSILQQESCESKLKTPSSKEERSRYRQRRKMSNDRTKKKERRGIKDLVWKRLEKCLKEPEKYHRLVKNDIFCLRFRVLRKRLLDIQVSSNKDIHNLTITLHKGNLECQGIQEIFPLLENNRSFCLYSAVRAIDLNQPFNLPQIQIQAIVHEEQRLEKVVTLPYCWLHLTEESLARSTQRSRIKTKACLEQMACTKVNLKGLHGILPGWNFEPMGRGYWICQSRMAIGDSEFELRVIEREGHFAGELSGRGEQRLSRMLQFLQQYLS